MTRDKTIEELKLHGRKNLSKSLDYLTKIKEKGGNPSYILDGLLHISQDFIEYAVIDDVDLSNELGVKFSRLKDFVKDNVYKNKSDTFENATVIGQFIEILIKNGLPRDASIEATAKWLKIGISTARTHNENFRKIYSIEPDLGLNLIYYLRIMNEKLKNNENFYSEHPKAKRAFLKTKNYYQEKIDYFENFLKNLG